MSDEVKMVTKPVIYTAEFVLSELQSMLKSLAENSKIVYIGELIEPKPYSYKRFCEWAQTYKENDEITGTIDKIKGTLLNRAVTGGLKNELNSGMTKFHLINNFDWRDKTETDITTAGEKLNTDLTPAMLAANAAAAKAYEKAMKDSLME